MSNAPLMPMATAVWLVENTTLTFKQIAEFCKLHEVEVQGIADGEVGKGIVGYNPIIAGQLTKEEINLSSEDPNRQLNLKENNVEIENEEKKSKTYIPLSKRQDKPDSALWLIKQHSFLKDTQIAKLASSTKPTVANIRAGNQSQPITEFRNPTDLGLCSYDDLEAVVAKGQRKAAKEQKAKDKAAKLNQSIPS